MGPVFFKTSRGYVNAAHIVSIDEADMATLTNGTHAQLASNWQGWQRNKKIIDFRPTDTNNA